MTPNTTHSGTGATPASGTRSVLRIAFLLLIAGLLLLGAGAAPVAADSVMVGTLQELTDAINAVVSGDRTIIVTATIDANNKYFTIGSGRNITLMPGETPGISINRTVYQGDYGGMFMVDGGRLTLAANKTNSASTLTINGIDDLSNAQSLVYIENAGTFTLEAGTLTNNRAMNSGGGVNVVSGTFTMTGGTISNNMVRSAAHGCGVNVDDGCTFTMMGGEISGNNRGTSGGVFIDGKSSFTMGGTAVIHADNTLHFNSGSVDRAYVNLSLPFTGSAKTIDGSSGFLTHGYEVVKVPAGTDASTYLPNFGLKAEAGGVYRIISDPDNQENLIIVSMHTLTVNGGEGGGSHITGTTVRITATETPGWAFSYWELASGGGALEDATAASTNFTMPDSDVIINARMIKAKYLLTIHTMPLNVPYPESGEFKSYEKDTEVSITSYSALRGYATFDHWISDNGGTFADSTQLSTTFTMPGNPVNLTAKYRPITYTVKYNGNSNTGGSTASSTHTYDLAQALTKNGFTKTGYTFLGWSESSGSTTATYIDEASVKNLTKTNGATVTLYAIWKLAATNDVTVNGGTTGGGSKYAEGATVTITATDKTGYTFGKWTSDSGVTFADPLAKSTTFVMPAKAVTITAVWNETLILNPNGGVHSISSVTNTYNEVPFPLVTIPIGSLTGYTYKGYATDTAGTTMVYIIGSVPANLAGWTDAAGKWIHPGSATSTTLYAVWDQTVTLNANGGDDGSQTSVIAKYNASAPTLTTAGFPTRAGNSFAGYATDAAGTTVLYGTDGIAKSGVAGWTDASGTWIHTGPATPLYAVWTPEPTEKTTVITLDGNGNTTAGTPSVTVTYGESTVPVITNPQKTGYTFGGWNTNNDGTGTTVLDTTGALTGDGIYSDGTKKWISDDPTLTLYAVWTEPVTLHPNGGTGGTISVSNTYNRVPEYIPSAPTAPQGYTFQGYADDTAGTTIIYTSTSVVLANVAGWTDADKKWIHPGSAAPVLLYAVWNQTVTLNANSGTAGSQTSVTAKYNASAPTLTTAGFPTRAGNSFGGYAADAAGTTVLYGTDGTVKPGIAGWTDASGTWIHTGPAALYAVWTPETTYQLTVVNGTGSGSYTAGAAASITLTEKPGYTFTGWTADGGIIAAPASKTTTIEMPAKAVTVTAGLQPHTYTVHYDGSGATSGTTADSTHTYDAAQPLTPNGFSKTDNYFAGWNKTGAAGTVVDYIDKASVKNLTAENGATVTLYAVWSSTPRYTVTVTGGGGSGSYAAGDPVRIEAIVPSGQTFDHWTVTGVTLDAPTSAAATFVMPANDVTATAVFKNAPVPPSPSPSPVPPSPSPSPAPSGGSSDGNMEHAYRVLFETAGGSFISPATGLSAGDRVAQPAAPVKDGYTFGGWYTNDACTKEWSFADRIEGDMTLYAKWTPLGVTPTATATATVTATATAPATATATATAPVVTASKTQEPTIQPDTRTDNPKQPASLPGFISWHLLALAAAALAALFLFWFFLIRRKTITFLVPTTNGIKQYRIRVRKNHTIRPDDLPDELLRHTWYLDGRHTDRWNFDEDTVIENITLYPGENR